MASLNKKWKDWKHEVHQQYLKYDNDEDRLANLPDRVHPDQWPNLVQWFGSEEAQARSITRKINRNQQDDPHKTGRTSHAVIRHEAEETEECELDRIDMYFMTHADKDGNPSSAKAATNMNNMTTKLAEVPVEERPPGYREKVFVEVMGPDNHGRVRTMGLGPTRRDVFGTSGSSRRSYQREMDEMREELEIQFESKLQERVNEAVQERVKEAVDAAVQATSAKFATELAQMKEMMSTMQGLMGSSQPFSSPANMAFSIGDDHVSPANGSASRIGQSEASASHGPSSHTIPITPTSGGNVGTTQPSLSPGAPVLLYSWDEPRVQVAVGKFISNDPQKTVDNTIVGEGNVEVLVESPIRPSYKLKFKRSDANIILHAIKKSVIWPMSKVERSSIRRRLA